ncbi:MAG: radical SAM protein [Oligoflexia bacterium]|nr:radical SAM protein [Oligoflexia bacterium]
MSGKRKARNSPEKRSSRGRSRDAYDREFLLEQETHLIAPTHRGSDLVFNLVYPNTYWIAMSNLGFQAVYAILGQQAGVSIERGFLPNADQEDAATVKPWRTFETERELADCDVLGFSMSFETDYPHLFRILANQRLLEADPAVREERADWQKFGSPLLIAGGTAVTLNPEPLADYLDVIVLGEAEELLTEFVGVCKQAVKSGTPRLELLRQLAQIEGIYVPRFHRATYFESGAVRDFSIDAPIGRPQRRIVKDISKFPTYSRILTSETEFSSMFLTETGRGCEVGCRFCVAGYIYRPVRKRSESVLAETVQVGLENSKAIGFVGAAVSSHRAISELTRSVARAGARASLSSIMSQKVSDELASSISESEYRTVALAPEAGSERLRFAVGKRVKNEQVVAAAERLAKNGIRGFKLYFIVGLPTETAADVEAIALLAQQVRSAVIAAAREYGKHVWINLSVNPFIPKACTPFQWEPMLGREELEAKIELVRSGIRGLSNLELKFEPPKESYFQALLSRGDRRVGRLLEYIERRNLDWKWLVKNSGREIIPGVPAIDFYVSRRIPFDEILPWDMVDSRIEKSLLMREALRAHGVEAGPAPSEVEMPLEAAL